MFLKSHIYFADTTQHCELWMLDTLGHFCLATDAKGLLLFRIVPSGNHLSYSRSAVMPTVLPPSTESMT